MYINTCEAEANVKTRLQCYPLGFPLCMQNFQNAIKTSEPLNKNFCSQEFGMRDVQLEI